MREHTSNLVSSLQQKEAELEKIKSASQYEISFYQQEITSAKLQFDQLKELQEKREEEIKQMDEQQLEELARAQPKQVAVPLDVKSNPKTLQLLTKFENQLFVMNNNKIYKDIEQLKTEVALHKQEIKLKHKQVE